MKIEAILLADHAAVIDGLLTVQGGAWEHVMFPFLPNTLSGYVAGVMTLDESEHGELLEVFLDVSDDSGQVEGFRGSMIANGSRPDTDAGVPVRLAFAMPFMTMVKGPTVMKASLSSEQDELAALTAAIRSTTPDTLPEDFED